MDKYLLKSIDTCGSTQNKKRYVHFAIECIKSKDICHHLVVVYIPVRYKYHLLPAEIDQHVLPY